MMNKTLTPAMTRTAWAALSAALALGLSACHTTPPRSAALEQAQETYRTAAASPDVTSAAPMELDRARKSLSIAQNAWAEKRDMKEVDHLAYLATQQAQVAINVGMQKAADNMVTAAGTEREKARADAKTQEAQVATQQAQTAQQRASDLEKQLLAMSAKQTNRGMVMVLQDVLFDVGQSSLKEGAQSRLERLAEVLKNNPERHIRIEGYTDSTGSDDLNQRLSEERARAVKDALVNMGISGDRIDTAGFGEQRPVATNKTAAGRQQNRRVEIIFSDDKGSFATG